MMRFLVTGGAGFIGSHLCEKLVQNGDHVISLDNFDPYYDPRIKRNNIQYLLSHPHFTCIEGSILNWRLLKNIFSEKSIHAVIHLAARAGVRPSIQKPRLYQKINIQGTVNLLEMSAKWHISKFILASSSSVYGKQEKIPFSEDDPVDNPISPYAASKKACELLSFTYHSLYGLSVTCLRFFTVYGPRQRPDMAIHKFTKCIFDGKVIPFYGDGKSRRDYTYISDIIHGIEKAIEKCQGYTIYNLGESKTIELDRLIKLLEKASGLSAKIKYFPNQPGDVPITYADVSRARAELGYNPQVSIEEGIPKFMEWFKKNRVKKG
jgi:UDP-glucuronate 4-epimerase